MRRTAATITVLAFLLAACGTEDGSGGGADGRGPGTPSARPASGHKGPTPGLSWTFDRIAEDRGELVDMAVVAKDDIWATGFVAHGANIDDQEPYLLHYDGTDWRRLPMPEAVGAHVSDFHMQSAGSGEVWLWGTTGPDQDGKTATEFVRWDGKRWTGMPAGLQWRVVDSLFLGPDDVWMLDGEDHASHWDGTRWTGSDLPATAEVIDGVAGDDIWALGRRDRGPGVGGAGRELTQPAAMHWDGSAWKTVDTPRFRYPDPIPPEAAANLNGIIALESDRVLAYGENTFNQGEMENEPQEQLIYLRWDGKRWAEEEPATGACEGRRPVARDGAKGLLLDGNWYLTADGACDKITRSRLPERDGVTHESQQSLWLTKVSPVPGTDKVLGVGHVEVNQSGDPLSKGVIVSLKR